MKEFIEKNLEKINLIIATFVYIGGLILSLEGSYVLGGIAVFAAILDFIIISKWREAYEDESEEEE